MYEPISPKSTLSTAQLEGLAKRFESLGTVNGLAQLIGVNETALYQAAAKQEYLTFFVPKPGGAKRLIEHPAPALKGIQQSLNRYLQAVYYGIKPDCAYGFIIRPSDDYQPRNIYFNALRHQKSEWFWQFDLKDFFHTVTLTHMKNLFSHLFFFPLEVSATINGLCCYKERLPMGAPTSPALSNFACLFMDRQLGELAQEHGAIYTRYADDLTFSFAEEPPAGFQKDVRKILERHAFVVNEDKVRLSCRAELPEITGLCVGAGTRPTLSKTWLKRLKQEVKVYTWLMTEAVRERGLFHAFVFDTFRRSVTGQVEFVGFVEGKDSAVYRKLAGRVWVG
jgi:Retron-type reverse transcriptase